jgi:predicted enzyme related to lactoylglutathione lyase
MANHISVVSIPVSDPERAKAFYADSLGFDVLADTPFGEGQRWVQLAPAGAQTSITLVTWFDDFPPGSVRGLVLDVDDIAASRERLEARGVDFTGDTFGTPWGSFAPFEDPDGNRWALHQEA